MFALPRPKSLLRLEHLVLGLLLLGVVFFAVRYAIKASEERSAFCRWRSQLLDLQSGVDLSAAHNYPNPPMMAILLEPLARLPILAGAMLWFGLKVVMAFVAVRMVFALLERGARQPLSLQAKILIVLLALKPILDDLQHGNINLFILFLTMSALIAWRAKHDVLGGLLLALAIACKVTPGLFVIYFAWKRAWTLLAACLVGLMLFLFPGIIPAWRLGHENNQRQLQSWYRVMVHPYLVENVVTSEYINQSLPGVSRRLLTESPSVIYWEGLHSRPIRFDNVLSLSPELVRRLVQGVGLLFLLAMLWRCRANRESEGWRLLAEWSVIVCGMLLFSERTWKQHMVTLLMPLAVIVVRAESSRWLWTVLVVVMGLLLLPGFATESGRLETAANPSWAKLGLIWGCSLWAVVILLLTQLALLGTRDPNSESASPFLAGSSDKTSDVNVGSSVKVPVVTSHREEENRLFASSGARNTCIVRTLF